jgi:hypothetical protein
MDLEAVLEQIEEGKNLFIERAKELLEQQEAFNKRVTVALNLSELGNSSTDKDGNDDILKINFGGRNMDIKRSILTRAISVGIYFHVYLKGDGTDFMLGIEKEESTWT